MGSGYQINLVQTYNTGLNLTLGPTVGSGLWHTLSSDITWEATKSSGTGTFTWGGTLSIREVGGSTLDTCSVSFSVTHGSLE